jgi:hypothetical protein
MRLLLTVLSLWTIAVAVLVIAGVFSSVNNEDSYLSTPITSREAVIATLLTIPALLLGFLVIVGLRPMKEA